MKPNRNQMRIRIDEGLKKEFGDTCARSGLDMSTVLRSVIRASIPYVREYGRDGNLYPPVLSPSAPTKRK